MLKKIFPAGVGNSPLSSFRLVIAAEGYLATEEARFAGDCVELLEGLFRIAPFNLTRAHAGWLSVYSSFAASASAGPSIDAPATAGRTRFESVFTSATATLAPSQLKVDQWITAETVLVDSIEGPATDMFARGDRTYGHSGALIVILTPSIAGHPAGGEGEATSLTATNVHHVSVSGDGLYAQLVARSMARTIGLGDEFELAGPQFQAAGATESATIARHFNLQMFAAAPPSPISGETKWFPLFTMAERSIPPIIHAKADPSTPDTTLEVPPAMPSKVELWEGGGGFRTNIWRSARDCLMRRRISDPSLPVRAGRVPFCPACHHFLRSTIW